MIINIQNNGKILKEKTNLKLPDFTILTGENGSGKTQLLEYLRDYGAMNRMMNNFSDNNLISAISDNNGKILKDIIHSYPGVKRSDNLHFQQQHQQQLIQTIKDQWKKLKDIAKSCLLIRSESFNNEFDELQALNDARIEFQKSMTTENTKLDKAKFIYVQQYELNTLKLLSEQTSKEIYDLTLLDYITFYNVYNDLFSSALDVLFHQFNLKQKYFSHLTQNISAPWIVFNDILDKAEFKYTTKYTASLDDEEPTLIHLIDRESGMKVSFESLSSGEKTILALIFVLYNSSNNGKFPEVILFDEPDAHLHPSLTKLFLDVIKEVLVEKQNVKVILTTHSPSTIALAPEESIYRMDRTLGYPIKEDKDVAVQNLSSGLASISIENGNFGIIYNINQTNKHILFTEGITDKIILEIAWKKLYDSKEIPFFVQDSFSVNFLGALFNQGNLKPDGIFHQFPHKALIALFDFDNAGYCGWNRDEKFPSIIESNPSKCLTRSNNKNGYLLLLPVPSESNIRNLVIKNGQETFKEKSNLTIESLFLNVPGFAEKYFTIESLPGGGSFYSFKAKKRKFAENLEILESKYFENFKPLFEKIEFIISSHNFK
ncbi:AAA family ATPase [Epilithonimonas lactis]|uniref:AAA+ ATPase domain-containing protein n=1 Tax=Epilithonimonas lactis TaxID=421072 RepID=A0A085BH51_9FLAO|nr:ATP-binding protein [Epilithonimonas lactis]KFC21796.1 hypothetical protein IO89_07350 [Epilithonimonas lactis]SEQ44821.1 AAA domain-containing protein, putative AbiEii toxin, Type IV TA system [Epilithonimonas lactis]